MPNNISDLPPGMFNLSSNYANTHKNKPIPHRKTVLKCIAVPPRKPPKRQSSSANSEGTVRGQAQPRLLSSPSPQIAAEEVCLGGQETTNSFSSAESSSIRRAPSHSTSTQHPTTPLLRTSTSDQSDDVRRSQSPTPSVTRSSSSVITRRRRSGLRAKSIKSTLRSISSASGQRVRLSKGVDVKSYIDVTDSEDERTLLNSSNRSGGKASQSAILKESARRARLKSLARHNTPPFLVGDAAERLSGKTHAGQAEPSRGVCFVTNRAGFLDAAHVMSVSLVTLENEDLILALDKSMFREGEIGLTIDSRHNMFYLSSELHRAFDNKGWLLVPQQSVLKRIRKFAIEAADDDSKSILDVYSEPEMNIEKVDDMMVFTYFLVPTRKMIHIPITRCIKPHTNMELPVEAKDVTHHFYPYADLGPLKSHVYPHLVIYNSGAKLAAAAHIEEYDFRCLQEHDGIVKESDAFDRRRDIKDIFQQWCGKHSPAAPKRRTANIRR